MSSDYDDPDDFQRGSYGPDMVDWQPKPSNLIDVTDEMVTAAAEAIEDSAMRLIGRDLGTLHRNDIVRVGLAAAFAIIECDYNLSPATCDQPKSGEPDAYCELPRGHPGGHSATVTRAVDW